MRLMIMNEDGTDRRVLMESAEFPHVGSPAISPDGTRLAFDAWRTGQGTRDSRILLMNLDGSGLQDLGDGLMPTWSPDGKRIALSRSVDYGVWLMEVGSGDLTLIDNQGWGIQWSPDGKSVAYSRGTEFLVQDLATGSQRDLIGEAVSVIRNVAWNAAWSPDSQRIVGTANLTNGQRATVVFQVSGGQPQPGLLGHFRILGIAPGYPDHAWHPTQPRILLGMTTPHTGLFSLYEYHADKDGPPRLVAGPAPQYGSASGSFTPDGKQLVYVETR